MINEIRKPDETLAKVLPPVRLLDGVVYVPSQFTMSFAYEEEKRRNLTPNREEKKASLTERLNEKKMFVQEREEQRTGSAQRKKKKQYNIGID